MSPLLRKGTPYQSEMLVLLDWVLELAKNTQGEHVDFYFLITFFNECDCGDVSHFRKAKKEFVVGLLPIGL